MIDKLLEDLTHLFAVKFKTHVPGGAPRAISEYKRVYDLFVFIANSEASSGEYSQEEHDERVRNAMVAAAGTWIGQQLRKQHDATVIVWRTPISVEEGLSSGEYPIKQLKLRFRAHVMSEADYNKGPIPGFEWPEKEGQETTSAERFKRYMDS